MSNTPFRSYKNNFHEGGISSPFIAWFPKKIKAGSIARGTGHLIDLAPTFYDFAGAKYPENYNGLKTNSLAGVSLKNVLLEGSALNREQPIFWERGGNRAVRKGQWKLVSTYPEKRWELYDLDADRGETTDVSAKNPEIVKALIAEYEAWAKKNNVENYEKIKPAVQIGNGTRF